MSSIRFGQLDKEEILSAYRFGSIEISKDDLLEENFEFVKYIDTKEDKLLSLYRFKLNKIGYMSFISLNRLIAYGYRESRIILKYEHGNIMAYIDSNMLKEEHKSSNYLYMLFTNKNELCYTCVGSPVKPNTLYGKSELNRVITTIGRFNTLIGSNRVEINYNNNSLKEELDDIPF